MNMLAGALLGFVGAVCLIVFLGVLQASGRPLAERFVDLLYRLAHLTAAAAHGADAGLVRFRTVREEYRAVHMPEYAQEEQAIS